MAGIGREKSVVPLYLGVVLAILLLSATAFCAAPETPVEITGIRLSWVGAESKISPKERGERSFWKGGGRPPSSDETRTRDMKMEGGVSGNWGKLDVEFTTYREWENEIEFRFYLLLKDKNDYKMLTGKTSVVYVARGRKHYAVMYAYPNAIARFGGDVQGMAVEAVVNGKVVSADSEPGSVRKQWWKEYSPIADAIIDWIYTPMNRAGIEEYELIKITK